MTYNCPCCTRPLSTEQDGDKIAMWCRFGPCECDAMNDGETGDTEQEAFDKLQQQYELWAEARA